jgi:hypothetical protein
MKPWLTRTRIGTANSRKDAQPAEVGVYRRVAEALMLPRLEKRPVVLIPSARRGQILPKGLDHLAAVREKLLAVTGRFAAFQAQWMNVHVDCPLLQRLAMPITAGTAKYPGIKIHDTRIIIIRLMEVLQHGRTAVSGCSTR